jgi:hypothetical protein
MAEGADEIVGAFTEGTPVQRWTAEPRTAKTMAAAAAPVHQVREVQSGARLRPGKVNRRGVDSTGTDTD